MRTRKKTADKVENTALVMPVYFDHDQRVLVEKTFGCCRKMYNLMLDDSADGEVTANTPAHYKAMDEYAYMKEVDSLALANAQMHLKAAFANHEDNPGHFGPPRHKSKKAHSWTDEDGKNHSVRAAKPSYTTNLVNGNIEIDGNRIKLPKLGWATCTNHREIPDDYRLKSVTVWRDAADDYNVSVLFERDRKQAVPVEARGRALKSLGLDYSSPHFYVDSDGNVASHPKVMRDGKCELNRKLAREKRRLSRMRKGSNNYEKCRRRIGELERKIARVRKDWIEKESTRIANEYDVVCIESLDMHGQAQSLNFGKAVHDNAWGLFVTRLEQKMTALGKHLVKVDRFFPSSKLCRACGCVNRGLKLGQQTWICPTCGEVHDRDSYAAETLRLEGLRVLAEEHGIPRDLLGLPIALDAA